MAGKTDPRVRLLGKFRSIARERLARLNAAFGELEQGDASSGTSDLVMREIHTLKGESHMMGFPDMNEIAHRTEDLLSWSRRHGFATAGPVADLVYQGFDLLLAYTAEDADTALLSPRKSGFLAASEELLSATTTEVSATEDSPAADGEPRGAKDLGVTSTGTRERTGDTERSHDTQETGRSRSRDSGPVGGGLGETIRVPAATLAALTGLAGQLIIHQQATARLVQTLWDEQRRASSRGAAAEPIRRLREEVFQADLRLGELQDTVRTLRLLQVGVMFERFPAAIRELARQHGRSVRVVLSGGEVAVDKQVLDLLDETILHLVRNSVDHGIEPPAERKAAGKPERGTLRLAARQLGSRVEIEVRDDGRGISPEVVRAAAVAHGLMTAEEVAAIDDANVLRLLFQAGFSTRDQVSDVSGRGVGLDVVSDKVRLLGGTVEVASVPGRGTRFTLTLPISIALVRVLCFRCGRTIFGLPSSAVHRVLRLSPDAIERAGRGTAIELGDRRIPLVDLRRTFHSTGPEREQLEAVVVEQSDTRLALAVDSFLGERQVVQRSLGAFLAGIRLLSGTGILEERQVALLLSVPELLRRWGDDDPLARALPVEAPGRPQRCVLVVDDSELTRDMLVTVARHVGLDVTEAVNGRDALAKVRLGIPDLILTDLDMPVMDGFELLARLRGDPELRHTPVVVLTTRGSDEDKRRAMAAGADAFLVKSRFSSDELGATIRRFLDLDRQ